MPCFVRSQQRSKEPIIADKEKEKVLNVWRNNYISSGEEVLSLTHLLSVEKTDNIRMIYNVTSRGLNNVLWFPYFRIPTMSTHMIAIKLVTNMGDINICEIFLKFMMHKSLRVFCGVDDTHILLLLNCLPCPNDMGIVGWWCSTPYT